MCRKNHLTILMLCGVMAFCSIAEETAKPTDPRRQLAVELLEIIKLQQQMERSFMAVRQLQLGMVEKTLGEIKDRDRAIAVKKQVADMVMKEFNWQNLREDFIAVYVDLFSEEELKAMIEFYGSRTGRRIIEKTPKAQMQAMKIIQTRMDQVAPRVIEHVKQSVASAKSAETATETGAAKPEAGECGKGD